MKDKNVIICEDENGTLYFDTELGRFFFVNMDAYTGEVSLARPGWFDLTQNELDAIGNWIKGLLNNGVLRS